MDIHPNATVTVSFDLTVSEDEANALLALTGYGFKPFRDAFYEKMGKAYLEPYVRGLESLFKAIDTQLPGPLSAVSRARSDLRAAELKRQADMKARELAEAEARRQKDETQ